MHKSVVITGIGVVTNLGQNVVDFWENCLAGRSIIEPIPQSWQFYSKYHSGIWSPLGEVNFKAKGFSDVELLQRDPVSLLAMDAAQQALADAGFTCILTNPKKNQYQIEGIPSDRCGVFVGTGIGGAKTFLENHAHQILASYKNIYAPENGESLLPCPPRTNPFVVSMLMPNSVSASIGIKYSLTGINRTVSQACASGSSAIGSAFRMIKDRSNRLCHLWWSRIFI
jgi:3-oxoacyl-(acyl-carrier-protein) synthase